MKKVIVSGIVAESGIEGWARRRRQGFGVGTPDKTVIEEEAREARGLRRDGVGLKVAMVYLPWQHQIREE